MRPLPLRLQAVRTASPSASCPKCPGVVLVACTASSCSVAFKCNPGFRTTFLQSDCKISGYLSACHRRLPSSISALHMLLLLLRELLKAARCHILGLDLETVLRCTEQVCILQASYQRGVVGKTTKTKLGFQILLMTFTEHYYYKLLLGCRALRLVFSYPLESVLSESCFFFFLSAGRL